MEQSHLGLEQTLRSLVIGSWLGQRMEQTSQSLGLGRQERRMVLGLKSSHLEQTRKLGQTTRSALAPTKLGKIEMAQHPQSRLGRDIHQQSLGRQ